MSDKFEFDEITDEALREKVRGYVGELRTEAARYRTERNDYRDKYTESGGLLKLANDKLDEAKELEEKYESLLTDNSRLGENLDRLKAAAAFGIPDEADRLKGSNFDEWTEDAKTLAEKFGTKRIPKDPAATEQPKPPKDDPITAAFRDKGYL